MSDHKNTISYTFRRWHPRGTQVLTSVNLIDTVQRNVILSHDLILKLGFLKGSKGNNCNSALCTAGHQYGAARCSRVPVKTHREMQPRARDGDTTCEEL